MARVVIMGKIAKGISVIGNKLLIGGVLYSLMFLNPQES
jgi:hypothetical protein